MVNFGLIKLSNSLGLAEIMQHYRFANSGVISLSHARFIQRAPVKGTGCWILAEAASIELNGRSSFSRHQTVVLTDPSAHITMKAIGRTVPVYEVFGVLAGSHFIRSHVEISSIAYDLERGNLRVDQHFDRYAIFAVGLLF